MRSMLAILRKDARHLRWHVLAFWTLLGVSAIVEPRGAYWRDPTPGISLLALFAAYYLIASVIHEEALTGDRHYWLTRPITGRQLLAAKAVFIGAAIVLPAIAAQAVSLAMLGIPVAPNGASLLRRNVVFAAIGILPVTALAAVTRNLMQFLLAAFLMLAATAGFQLAFSDTAFPVFTVSPWVMVYGGPLALGAAAAVLVWTQYVRRATGVSRAIMGVVIAATLFAGKADVNAGVAASARIEREATAAKPPAHPSFGDVFAIPIRIDGLPAGTEALAGKVHSQPEFRTAEIRGIYGGRGKLVLSMNPAALAAPVRLRGWVDMILFQRTGRVKAPAAMYQRVSVPRAGMCMQVRTDREYRSEIVCLVPDPHAAIALDSESSLLWIVPPGLDALAPDLSNPFQPVGRFAASNYVWGSGSAQWMITARTVGSLRAEFDFPDIRLADYRVAE